MRKKTIIIMGKGLKGDGWIWMLVEQSLNNFLFPLSTFDFCVRKSLVRYRLESEDYFLGSRRFSTREMKWVQMEFKWVNLTLEEPNIN